MLDLNESLIRNKRLGMPYKPITTDFQSLEHNYKWYFSYSETTLLATSWRRRSIMVALIYSIMKEFIY